MHQLHSISDVRRLRLASLLLLGNRLLMLTAMSMLLVSIFANDQYLMVFGSILVAASFVLIIALWIVASHAGCASCRASVLGPVGCVKHPRARRLLESNKLQAALAMMFKERFRCPYCNEPTAMQLAAMSGVDVRDPTGAFRRSADPPLLFLLPQGTGRRGREVLRLSKRVHSPEGHGGR